MYHSAMSRRISDIAHVTQGLSTFGRGAGVRPGEWSLRMVESSDIGDSCWLDLDGLREIRIDLTDRTERHLLQPLDVLVTARSGYVQAMLVPRNVVPAVASVTLLLVRPHTRTAGLYIWYFLMSTWGQAQLKRRLTVSPTVISLSAANLAAVELPMPSPQELDRITQLVETSEEAYAATLETARLMRGALRDSVIGAVDPAFVPRI